MLILTISLPFTVGPLADKENTILGICVRLLSTPNLCDTQTVSKLLYLALGDMRIVDTCVKVFDSVVHVIIFKDV